MFIRLSSENLTNGAIGVKARKIDIKLYELRISVDDACCM